MIHARAEQGVRGPRLRHRVLAMHQDVAVDGGFKAVDAFQKGACDLLAGDLPRVDARGNLREGERCDVCVGCHGELVRGSTAWCPEGVATYANP